MSRSARLLLVACLFVGVLTAVPPAWAAETGAQWTVSSVSRPTNFEPAAKGGVGSYVVRVTNSGGAASAGAVTVTDELPEGLEGAPGVNAEDELLGKVG